MDERTQPEPRASSRSSPPPVRILFDATSDAAIGDNSSLREAVRDKTLPEIPGALAGERSTFHVSVENQLFEVRVKLLAENELVAYVSFAELDLDL